LAAALGVDVFQATVEIWSFGTAFLRKGYIGIQNQRGRNGSPSLAAFGSKLKNGFARSGV
jgi:hypothetical protein